MDHLKGFYDDALNESIDILQDFFDEFGLIQGPRGNKSETYSIEKSNNHVSVMIYLNSNYLEGDFGPTKWKMERYLESNIYPRFSIIDIVCDVIDEVWGISLYISPIRRLSAANPDQDNGDHP